MANQDYPEQRTSGPDQRNAADGQPDPIANTQAFRAFAHEPEPARTSKNRGALLGGVALLVVVVVVLIVLATR